MSSEPSRANRIEAAVTSWDGVTAHDHRFGGREFRYGRRELGHLHGDHLADLPFPKRIAAMLVETGRAEPHRFAKAAGSASRSGTSRTSTRRSSSSGCRSSVRGSPRRDAPPARPDRR